jgi:enoyl-[acyl-carrier protein] reductase II
MMKSCKFIKLQNPQYVAKKENVHMISTVIDQSLGLEFPIFQGGMAWVADAYLAAGVSNAGGLGLIAAMNSNGEQLRAEIRKCKELTDKPFGVNVMLASPYAEEAAQVVIEEGIKVITTGAGNPGKYMAKWLEAGIKVIPVVASVALARKMEKSGAFAVIAEGGESGGHVGDLTTMALVPQVVDAVSIPVIAAGGIADGRQIAAAFMLGAVGVQVGTRFLVATECTIAQEYKDRVIKAKDIDTVVTGKRLGHPVRSIRNAFTREYLKKEYNEAEFSDEELEQMGTGSVRKAVRGGDVSHGTVLAGQVAAMVKKEQPAREMIEEMFTQAEEVLNGATKWVK